MLSIAVKKQWKEADLNAVVFLGESRVCCHSCQQQALLEGPTGTWLHQGGELGSCCHTVTQQHSWQGRRLTAPAGFPFEGMYISLLFISLVKMLLPAWFWSEIQHSILMWPCCDAPSCSDLLTDSVSTPTALQWSGKTLRHESKSSQQCQPTVLCLTMFKEFTGH